MRRSEELIAEALRRAAERDGMRMKVRMSRDLKRRAAACARVIGEDLDRWVFLACQAMKRGEFNGVAWEEETQKVTRDGSEPVWVRAPKGLNAPQVRLAIACAVRVSEERGQREFETDLVEGRDYLLERDG